MLRILILAGLAAFAMAADKAAPPKLDPEARLAAEQARRKFFESSIQMDQMQKQLQALADDANKKIAALRETCMGEDVKAPVGVFDSDALTCTAPAKEAKK